MSNRAKVELAALLLELELQLMDPVVRKDRAKVSEILAEEFEEFGSSGRVWSREAIITLIEEEIDWQPPVIEDFTVQTLSSDAALATYKAGRSNSETANLNRTSLRSSLWVVREGRWQLLFHQGTMVPTSESAT